MGRVMVLGIDGCPEEMLMKWMLDGGGWLPNFKRLYDSGAFLTMRSTVPYWTVPAWLSMLTGKTPKRLNVFGFYHRKKESYENELVRIDWEKHNPLWRILSDAGKRSIFVNVPTTEPPTKGFNGAMVGGSIMNPDPHRIAYPAGLNRWLLEQGYVADDYASLANNPIKHARKMIRADMKRIEIAKQLMADVWDLFMFAFYFSDPILHRFWKYIDEKHKDYEDKGECREVVYEYFKMVDDFLGYCLDRLPADGNLFVVSDHGMGQLRYFVDLNKWLFDNGYMALKNKGRKRFNMYHFQYTRLYDWLRRAYLPFRGIGLAKGVRDRVFGALPKWERTSADVDWERTRAYSFGKDSIYFNLKGRDPQGMYWTKKGTLGLYGKILKSLHSLRDPDTGECIVWDTKHNWLVDTMQARLLPDMFIEFEGGSYYISNQGEAAPGGKLFYERKETSAAHKRNTIFVGYGHDIEKKTGGTVDICDIAPTILHMLGVPIPDDVDGEVLSGLFREKSPLRGQKEVRKSRKAVARDTEAAVSGESDAVVEKRLRELGYL